MTALTRSRATRWAVPGLVVAVVAVVASGVLNANATAPLPPRTAAQLLVDLQTAHVDGMSGTIVQNANLGIPQLPSPGGTIGGESLATLLTGSHTLKVWTAGDRKQRLALLDTLGETDVVHNGQDAWYWTSSNNAATHYRLPADATARTPERTSATLTPQQAAEQALAAIDPTTSVGTNGTASVAGRSAYELVLRPRDSRSLIGQVRLAIDAQTHVPLRVQVYPKTSASGPAFEVGFTRVSFAVPGDEEFTFTPPPGAVVKQGTVPSAAHRSGSTSAEPRSGGPRSGALKPGAHKAGPLAKAEQQVAGSQGRLVGTGWTTVAVIPGVQLPGAGGSGDGASSSRQLLRLLDGLPRVSGAWGSGKLLTSTLVSVLLTDDGRMIAGAVTPDLLYAAAGQR